MYHFRTICLSKRTILISYVEQLSEISDVRGELCVKINDYRKNTIENVVIKEEKFDDESNDADNLENYDIFYGSSGNRFISNLNVNEHLFRIKTI